MYLSSLSVCCCVWFVIWIAFIFLSFILPTPIVPSSLSTGSGLRVALCHYDLFCVVSLFVMCVFVICCILVVCSVCLHLVFRYYLCFCDFRLFEFFVGCCIGAARSWILFFPCAALLLCNVRYLWVVGKYYQLVRFGLLTQFVTISYFLCMLPIRVFLVVSRSLSFAL